MSEDRLKILLEVGLGSGIGELQKLETSLKNLDTYSTSAQAGLKKITDVDFGRLSSQIDSVAGGMQKIGAAMSLIGVPMGLIAKESINMYADLESQIQRNTALLGGGKAEYEQILALSKELGASSPFDALEIGAGIEALAAAGYSLQDIQAAMPTVTEMAVATGEDLNSMSEILIATLNSYGESADMAGVYGDKLATIANISSASITDFGESMKYVGGIADAFGVDIDELGAVIGALADVNIKGSMAGTGLRSIITDLTSPTAKINDIFASFGLTMDDLNPKVVDFVEILQKMKDAGVSDEALMAAFGDRGGVVAVNMLSQLDKVKANYETLQNDSVGMLKKFSAQMRDTLKFVMDEMGGTIANIMIEIGEGLKPIVQEMGQWLNDNQGTLVEFAKNAVEGLTPFVEKFMSLSAKLMEWFNSLPDDMQSKVAGLTGLGSAMATIGGPLLLLGSLPVSALGKISGGIDKIKKSVMGSQAAATELMILTDAINALAAAQVASVVDVTPGGDKSSKRSATKGITSMADETLVAADVLGDAGSTFLLAGDRYEKDVDAAKKRIKTAQEWDHEFFNYDTDNLLGSQKSTVNLKRGATEIADSFDFVDAALTGSILGSEVSSVNFKRNAKEVVDSVDEVADGLKAKKIDISDSIDIIGDAFSLDSLSKQGTVKKAVKELADDLDEIPSRFSKIADPFKNVGETVAASVSKFSSSTKTALSTAKTEMLLLGSTAATELTAMLSTLPGIGVAIAGAAAIGIAAYMTNFGDFRDNVNDIMAEIGSAVNNINTGNYEAAGRDCAQAFANGLESVADLAVAAITSIPDAVKAFDEMSRGFDAALSEISVGFGQGLRNIVDEGVASFSSALSSASVDVSSFVSGIITQITSQDWSSPGDAIGNLIGAGINGSTPSISGFIDGIASQLTSFDWEGLLLKTLLSVSLPGLGPVGSGVVGDVLSGFINPKSGNGSTETISNHSLIIEQLEKEIETPLRNAGVSVKKFATQSAADIHNAMEKWQESFKESKLSYEDWMDSLKKSGQFDEYIADMQKYAETFPEITKEAGSAAQVIQGLDFMPVEFKAGNSIYANYKNNVLTPIVSEPIQIMLENATESEFNYILTHYNEIKNQIENSPINITYVGPAGDPEPNWGVTPHYTPDIQPNPNNATLNVNVVSMPQSFTDKYKDFDKESQLKMWNALTPDAQSKFGGSTQSTPDNKTVNQNTDALNNNASETRDLSKTVSQLYRDYPDWDSYQNMYMLQHKGASSNLAYQAYKQDQKYAGNSPDSSSIGWEPGDPDPRAKPYNNVSSSNKSLESTNKKLESTSAKLINVFDKGTSKDEALAKIIEKFNGDVNKISGQKFAIGEDEYTVQRKGLSFEAHGSNPSAQMKDDFIKYGEELDKLNKDKTDALNQSLKNDENWIEAQRTIASQYDEKLKSLENKYGMTVSEYRKLESDGETGLGKFGSIVKDTGKELSTLPKIAFKAIDNAFAPKQMGSGDPLSQDELNTLLRGMGRSKPSDISDEDWDAIVKANGGLEALARAYGGVIDETGRRIDTSSDGYREYNKLLEKSVLLQDSLNEIYDDEIVSKNDAIKWIRAYNSQFDDTLGETKETEDNIKASRNLLEIYRKSTDLQTYYADAIGDGTYSVEEQTEVSERYADVLKYLKDMGIDATGALEGLPPALKGLVEAILNIIKPVKESSDSASPDGATSNNPTKTVLGKTSEASHQLFAKMQSDFKTLNDQYKSGAINQSTYISKMKELSVHWDTVSRGPTIYKEALLGEDRQNAQNFIRMIKEQFRLDIGATGADGQKNYDPSQKLTKSIDDFITIKPIPPVEIPIAPIEPVKIPVELSQYPTRNPEVWKGGVQGNKPAPAPKPELGDSPRRNEEVWKGLTKEIDTNSQTTSKAVLEVKDLSSTTSGFSSSASDATNTLVSSSGILQEVAKSSFDLNSMLDEQKVKNQETSDILQVQQQNTVLANDSLLSLSQTNQDLSQIVSMATSPLDGFRGSIAALGDIAAAAMAKINEALAAAQAAVASAGPAMPVNSGPQYSPYTGPTVFNPSSESVIAAQNISRYGVCRNGDWLRQYASGGPVTQNGPAYLHQGEYVLRRDEVGKLTSGSPNVNLNINMSNSRFGNSELQKDLPKRIARETRRALARSGI